MNQKYNFFMLVLAAIVVAGVLGGWVSQTTAAQPPKVYGLYDNNNVYIGDVLGVVSGKNRNDQESIMYTSYIPSLDAIIQFESTGNYTIPEFLSVPALTVFEGPDCTGNAYISNQVGTEFINPWVVRVNGLTYKSGTETSAPAQTLSLFRESVGVCENQLLPSGGQAAIPLILITLPFEIDAIELPFEIR